MLLAVTSIYQDWLSAYYFRTFDMSLEQPTPLFNVNFLSSLLFVAAFSAITQLNFNKKYPGSLSIRKELEQLKRLRA